MSEAGPLRLLAIAGSGERPVMEAAGRELARVLAPAVPVTLTLQPPRSDAPAAPGSVALLSMLAELERPEEAEADIMARWRARIAALNGQGCAAVLLLTVFHHVPRGATAEARAAAMALRERIRRLGLVAARLSHETGAGIVDIDRVCTLLGGDLLQADWRLDGRGAAIAAGHATAWAVLAFGLDELIPAPVQDAARQAMGGASHIARLGDALRDAALRARHG